MSRSHWLWTAVVVLAGGAGAPHAGVPDAGPAALELVVLGSGGPGATGRASASYAVLVDGKPRILVDAGSGAFARIGESKLSLDSLDVILLTHLHVDHAAELPGIVKARAVSAGRPISFHVYGPRGRPAHAGVPAFPSTARYVDLLFGPGGAFAYLKDFAAPISFQVTDLPSGSAPFTESVMSANGLTVRAISGHHGDAPAVIYRIDYGGRSIAFSGDIDPAGLPALQTISQDANVLVFNSVVLDPPGSPEVLYGLHSPPRAIAPVVAAAHVGVLLMSHLSPAVEAQESAVSASIAKQFRGTVKYAEDGMHLVP